VTGPPTIVVIGASVAGAKAADGARTAGFEGQIFLIGDEGHPPYKRPPLSKELLRGEIDADATRVHPADFYDDAGIEVVAATAVAVDPKARTVTLSDGADITFTAAVLATGAAPRPLGVEGSDVAGVHYLRTVDDAARLSQAIRAARRVAVVGAGWVGSEVAASALQLGVDVVLIDRGPAPLHRPLGPLGRVFADLHREHSVELRLGTGVRAVVGQRSVEGVVLDDGRTERADVVVAAVGVTPRVDLARTVRGLQVDNGIVVDHYLQSSIPGVFAAGDVANAWHPLFHRFLRIEHSANAHHQGLTAGGNAAGLHEPFSQMPYFFSDQFDLGMEFVGHARRDDRIVVRGDLEARKFIAFWERRGVVSAAMQVNVADVTETLTAIVAARTPVDPRILADASIPLDGVLP
jgi:3-phenylpropionate/trans-cinnamate dioxygenase ferredoxin reductase subunit